MLRNKDGVGGGGCQIFRKKSYEGVRFDVICVMRGWVGVQFPEKKRDVRLEWPLRHMHIHDRHMHRHTQTLAYQHAVSQLGICQYISYFEKKSKSWLRHCPYANTCICMQQRAHLHALTCKYMNTQVTCEHMNIHTYKHIDAHTYMRTHEHTHIQTHGHTHTHTHANT